MGTKIPHEIEGNSKITGSLSVDTISEVTAANGVTVDGCLIKDGAAALAASVRKAATELTISAGAITITGSAHTVDGEGDADDDLITISGGTAGQWLVLYPENAARNITIKHGTGNIVTGDGNNITIPDMGIVFLYYDGSNWRVISGTGVFNNSVSGTFVNADLSSGVLTITHTYGLWYPSSLTIYDNDGQVIDPDDVTVTTNSIAVDLSTYGTITGTWRYAAGDAVSSVITTFLTLTDTPSSFSGQSGKLVAVNTGETALEFVTAPSGGGEYVELMLNVPGTLDTSSTTALATISKFPAIWNLPNAVLVEVKAKVLTADGTSDPTIQIVLNGTSALSSALSVNETLATGTIDTANDDIAAGQTIEINLTAGGGSDAADLVVYLKFQYA